MSSMQEAEHGLDHDYEPGSPHLRHSGIRNHVVAWIRDLVEEQFTRRGTCRVLEIGAGHGGFTEVIAATGAEVTVTEMSRPSIELLQRRFARNSGVRIVYDRDGEAVFSHAETYGLVLCISVLHHIPDYLAFIDRLTGLIDLGGSFASFQDPSWYPRRAKTDHHIDRGAYYLWRLIQPDLVRGVRTRARRVRGVYDQSNPADMVEYHVVRNGVDELAIQNLLSPRFAAVTEWRYWSTQSAVLQRVGEALDVVNTFGVVARDCQRLG